MLTGKILRDAFISGANNIANNKQAVDALNVFPVPDGDTGTNMGMTIAAAKREVERLDDDVAASEVAKVAASALLRGARGNSGVILSLLFRGFAKGITGRTAGAAELAKALDLGVKSAYKAVMKPTEGTILIVARVAAEKAALLQCDEEDIASMFHYITDIARETLAQTPEMLPVLKKAGVVDAGGQGLVCVFEGMLQVFEGGEIVAAYDAPAAQETEIPEDRNAAGEFETEITFGYCTEFIVVKKEDAKEAMTLRAYLESIGDSVVVVDDDEIIKCHVHTDNPGNALQKGLEYGALTKMKIENMREQHAEQKKAARAKKQNFEAVPIDPDQPFGFVAVAAGEGVKQLFLDLGVNNVVSGGQTMNPSTDDILGAINATPSQTVFVLPNNKNIIMAAEQTIHLTDRVVKVLPTRTIPQGLTAMLNFDPDLGVTENEIAMNKAADRVGTGQITFAARDSDYEGRNIKAGELLALENGKLSFTDIDLTHATLKLTKSLLKRDSAFVTLILGEDVSDEEGAKLEATLGEKLPESVELSVVKGGQPVYYCIISVE
ncbi:MAG: DAK2 domain-containing protein [Oscillospiraceae bacterium]|nr:DAK2 domain-containing protein [Oscillospiraceae bacterium]